MDKAETFLHGANFKCSSLEHYNELSQAFEVQIVEIKCLWLIYVYYNSGTTCRNPCIVLKETVKLQYDLLIE